MKNFSMILNCSYMKIPLKYLEISILDNLRTQKIMTGRVG